MLNWHHQRENCAQQKQTVAATLIKANRYILADVTGKKYRVGGWVQSDTKPRSTIVYPVVVDYLQTMINSYITRIHSVPHCPRLPRHCVATLRKPDIQSCLPFYFPRTVNSVRKFVYKLCVKSYKFALNNTFLLQKC